MLLRYLLYLLSDTAYQQRWQPSPNPEIKVIKMIAKSPAPQMTLFFVNCQRNMQNYSVYYLVSHV